MASMLTELYLRVLNLFSKTPSDNEIDLKIAEYESGPDHPDPAKNAKKTCELNLPGGRYACRNKVKVYACEMTGIHFKGNGVSRDEPCL